MITKGVWHRTPYGRMVARDWVAWHEAYDRPGSDLSRRLDVVQARLTAELTAAVAGPIRLLSLCAGDGRDVLGVLEHHPRAADVQAVLVESDPELVASAERMATALGVTAQIRRVDAGAMDSWSDAVPAHVVLACGVFGNLHRTQVERCIAALPMACAPGAALRWTRGRGPEDPGPELDRWLRAACFEPIARVAPERARYRVGVDRYVGPARAPSPGGRLFTSFRPAPPPAQSP